MLWTVGVQFSGLLRSPVALLATQTRCELLESAGLRFLLPQRLCMVLRSAEAPQGLLFGPGGHVST